MFKKVLVNVIGFIFAVLAFVAMYLAVYWGVTLLAKIPILGAIIYYPSDGAAVRTISCITSSVFAGSFVSAKICGNAKLFAGILIALNAFTIVRSLLLSALGLAVLWECGLFIITAGMCWKLDGKTADEL